MKKLPKDLVILTIAIFLLPNFNKAQSPFGMPPGGNNQSATPDTYLSNLTNAYVAASPANGASHTFSGATSQPTCFAENIIRTGNDIQAIPGTSDMARAMVWDGDCPSFSLTISNDPYFPTTNSASFVVELNGNNFGKIKDPDIIISQQTVNTNEIAILIVYELEDLGVTYIAYEQWNYNYLTSTISFIPSLTAPSIISVLSGIPVAGSSPNIDANSDNQFAIAFEISGVVYSYVGLIGNPTNINLSTIFAVNSCYSSGVTPDVAISNDYPASPGYTARRPVVSYVFKEDNPVNTLYLVQNLYTDLINNVFSCSHSYILGSGYINPRIAVPKDIPNNEYQFAVVAKTKKPTGEELIQLFYNYLAAPAILGTTLNSYPVGSNPLEKCGNTFPAISFSDDYFVSVAWTFDINLCAGGGGSSPTFGNWDRSNPATPGTGIPASGSKEIVAVSYNVSTNTRTPSNTDYFMLASSGIFGDQESVSIAGFFESGFTHGMYYSFATTNYFTTAPLTRYDMISKVSKVSMQPQLRKKMETSEIETHVNLVVYPNPTNDIINLNFSNLNEEHFVNLRIINIEGKSVYEKNGFSNSFSGIDAKPFSKGLYFIEYRVKDSIYREKLIIN